MLTQKEREWIECHFNKLNDRITDIRIEIAKLKVKAGIWGAIGAVIVAVAAILLRKV